MVWMWSHDGMSGPGGAGPGHQGSTASLDRGGLPPPQAYQPQQEAQGPGPGIRAWQHGWTPLAPPVGLGPGGPGGPGGSHGNLHQRVPSPNPHGGFPGSGQGPTGMYGGGPIEVPVVVKGPNGVFSAGPSEHEIGGGLPRHRQFDDMKAVPVRGVSPGPQQVHLQQQQLQNSRSASPMPLAGGGYPQEWPQPPPGVGGLAMQPGAGPPGGGRSLTPRHPGGPPPQQQWGVAPFQQGPRGVVPQRAPPNMGAPMVSMPTNLLGRIDSVVSEMERELTEDAVQSPLSGMQRPQPSVVNATDGGRLSDWIENQPASADGEGGRTIDWLDKQIWAIEQRREACEMRQTHLAELRRIVADGKTWSLTPDGETMEEGGSQGSGRHLASDRDGLSEADHEVLHSSDPAQRGRLTLLEREHAALKSQVLVFERERANLEADLGLGEPAAAAYSSAAPSAAAPVSAREASANQVIEAEKRRSLLAEEVANERVLQAAVENQTLLERLLEAQTALERERLFSEEAAEAQQSAEADLRTLEDKSRDVLQDCRALQATVLELEAERVQMGEAQAASARHIGALELELANPGLGAADSMRMEELVSELASQDNHARHALELESELTELRTMHDTHLQHAKMTSSRASELEDQIGHARAHQEHREAERNVHLNRIMELEALLGSGQATEADWKRKVQDLDEQLSEVKGIEARQRSQGEQYRSDNESLEEQLRNLRVSEETHIRNASSQRQRVAQLEQQASDGEASEGAHTRQHGIHRARLQELEQELFATRTSEETNSRQHVMHKSTIADLERQLEEQRSTQELHSKQQGGHRARLLELEQELEAAQQHEGNHTRQLNQHRTQIAEMEQQLQDSNSAKDSHARQLGGHKQRVSQLEQELELAQSAEAAHLRTHSSLKSRVAELEQLQLQSSSGEENASRQLTTHRDRISVLELELDDFHSAAGELGSHKARITQLELELSETRSSEAEHRSHVDRHRLRIQELENSEAALSGRHASSVGDLDLKVSALTSELSEERARAAEQRAHLEMAKKAAEDTQLFCQDALQKQDALQRAEKVECDRELETARLEIEGLQRELKMQQQRPAESLSVPMSSMPFSQYAEDLSGIPGSMGGHGGPPSSTVSPRTVSSTTTSVRRESLQVSSVSTRRPLSEELLPSSGDPFVKKVRAAEHGTRELLDKVSASHVKSIESQLQGVLEAREEGRELREGVQNYPGSLVLESERRMVRDQVEGRSHDLKAMMEELEIQQQLSFEDKQEVMERIKLNIEKCEAEFILLGPVSALADVPHATLQTLVDVLQLASRGQRLTDGEWTDGFSPMHWAAEYGRRDIIEYLTRLEGGAALLNARDKHGRTPLYYVNGARRPELALYLVEAGATMPMHSQDRRPSVSSLPAQYMMVLQQIETHGWYSMNWKDGYTMLHWAAEKDHAELCRYLINMDADPLARDSKDRTPVELAARSHSTNAQALLHEISRKGTEMNLQALSGSQFAPARNSQFVPTSMAGFGGGHGQDDDASERESVTSASGKGIPEAYIKVIDQIEKLGWDKMLWARGFTLLHWAAKNDMPDLCAHFMFQKANPEHRDDAGKTALEYARDTNSRGALEQLQRGAPLAEPKLQQLVVSKKARSSMLVQGTLMMASE